MSISQQCKVPGNAGASHPLSTLKVAGEVHNLHSHMQRPSLQTNKQNTHVVALLWSGSSVVGSGIIPFSRTNAPKFGSPMPLHGFLSYVGRRVSSLPGFWVS